MGTGGTSLGGGNGSLAYTEVVPGLLAGTTYYYWFRVSPSNPGSCSDVFGARVPTSGGTPLSGSFAVGYAQGATGLNPGTTYFYCSIAQNSQGTTLGNVLTFTTPDVPTVTTGTVLLLTPISVTLTASSNPNDAAAIGWVRYSASNPGVCSDGFGTRVPVSAGTGVNLGAGNSPVNYSWATGNALLPSTTYYYCALSSNSVGTGMSSLQTFTTPADLPQVTTSGASAITGTLATLNARGVPRGAATTGWRGS